MATFSLPDLLTRFFELLAERELAECADLLASTRAEVQTDLHWLDYLQAILWIEQAPPRWDLAGQILDRLLITAPPDDLLARIHLEIAFVADYLGDYRRAIEHNQMSLALFEALDDQVYQAKVRKNTGIAHTRAFERGQVGHEALHEALACHQRSLTLCQALGEERLAATVELELGTVHKSLGQWPEALTRYAARADKCRRFGWPRSLALTLNNLGEVHHHLGQWPQARECYEEALAILADLPSADPYEEAEMQANLALTRWAQGQAAAALEASDRAISLIEIIRRPLQSETARIGFFSTRIRSYEQRVWLDLERGRPHAALTTLERAKSRAFIELLAGRPVEPAAPPGLEPSAEWASLHEVNPLGAAGVQERLPADTLLLEYFVTPDCACVFLVTRNSLTVTPLAAGLHAGLARLFEPGEQRLARLAPGPGERLHHPWPLPHLYRLLVEPIAAQIKGWPRLCIVPYGPLHYIPFHALSETMTIVQHTWLGNEASGPEVTYGPSATVLLEYCRSKPPGRGQGGLVLSYGEGLRYVRSEAAAVASRLSGLWHADAAATREAVFGDGPNHPILHFACHGHFEPLRPLASGLDLADGRLEAGHILERLRLQADLVVLSGCETGHSRLHRGDELIGLVRAFIFAGTPSVLVTLWPVDDVSTRILMERFYDRLLADDSPASALRQAQWHLMTLATAELRERLRADGLSPAEASREIGRLQAAVAGLDSAPSPENQRLFAHPYYWAPFMLVGDRLASVQ